VTAGFLTFLLDRARESDADIVLPVDAEGCAEPLCAAYALASREGIRRAVEQGTRKVTAAFGGLRVRQLPPAEYAEFDGDGQLFANVNTPAEWESLA
jgi:molybdopterin-guanine dinucleotide biosynthesis protein A